MPFFSIIIPVYNAGTAVLPLFDSLLKQDYKDFEIIIINDGSSDNSETIIMKYEKKFKYFKYIYKENAGTSSARNTGLNNASGEYILFADADDKYEESTLLKLYNFLSKQKRELVCFNYYNYYLDKHKEVVLKLNNERIYLDKEKTILNFLNYNYINSYASAVWNKVYQRKIIEQNGLRFSKNLVLGEDLIFNIEYFCCIKNIDLFNEALYYYLQSENSIMRSYRKNNIEYVKAYVPVLNDLLVRYNCENLNYKIYEFFISNFFGVINNEVRNPSYQSGKEKIKDFCKQEKAIKEKSVAKMSFKNTIYYLLIKTKLWHILYFLVYKKEHFK